MNIIDEFEETDFEIMYAKKATTYHGYKRGCFGVVYNCEYKRWKIIHLPSGISFCLDGFPNVTEAMQCAIDIAKIRNDWYINPSILTEDEADKIIQIVRTSLKAASSFYCKNEDLYPSPTPLNNMSY